MTRGTGGRHRVARAIVTLVAVCLWAAASVNHNRMGQGAAVLLILAAIFA